MPHFFDDPGGAIAVIFFAALLYLSIFVGGIWLIVQIVKWSL